jgi:O-antigen ligase
VIVFWIIAARRPEFALLFIFASAPFQNDLSSGGPAKFSIAELGLLLTVPVFLFQNWDRRRILAIGPIAIPVALYFAICLYSSFMHWRGSSAVISLMQMLIYLVIVVSIFSSFVRKEEHLALSLDGIIAVGAFLSLVILASSSNYVLGLHKNGAGGSLSCAVIIGLELWLTAKTSLRRWLLSLALVITTAGLLFTLSRGAWLATFFGVAVIIAIRRPYKPLMRAGLVLIPLVAIFWQSLPQESREYTVGFSEERGNIKQRYINTAFAINEYKKEPLYGTGVGLRKEYDATSIILLTLAETGVLGLAALSLIYVAFLRMVWTTRKHFVPTEPCYSFLVLGGALLLSRLGHGLVDHYWSRGALMIAWASAGMATGAYYIACDRLKATRRL